MLVFQGQGCLGGVERAATGAHGLAAFPAPDVPVLVAATGWGLVLALRCIHTIPQEDKYEEICHFYGRFCNT